ncbi:hypothetical protein [Citreimonas sp.]|uniref:hypothetical protein n=1 Tax=Citreimonas sp. TaxID=3036715 RepID=UPI00405828FE
MSDPVPNDDADEVLSSIRRLVAEKPEPARVPAAHDAARRPGRFVLTDALRVVDPAVDPQSHADQDGPEGRRLAPVVLTGPTFPEGDEADAPAGTSDPLTGMVRRELARAAEDVTAGGDIGPAGDDTPRSNTVLDGERHDQPTGATPDTPEDEALRRLVAEISRAELQGALGERITRNVQKLVRREIQRALLTRDME